MRITRDFEASEGVFYCAYPEPLKAPELSVSRLPSSVFNLDVKISTVSGRPAPGRTVVRLELRDPEGRICDESGLYRVVNGTASIPLRFAADDPKGGLFSGWKATVTDLTTGLTAAERFSR